MPPTAGGVAFPDISYGYYAVFARLYGIPVRQVPLRADFRLVPEDYNHLHRTIVLANPNAPTGLALSRDEVEGIVRANPDAVVVVDEAMWTSAGRARCPSPPAIPTCWWCRPFPSPAPWREPGWATPSGMRP